MDRFWVDADFCSVLDVSEITRWESAVFTEKEDGAGSVGRTVVDERFRVAGSGVSSVTGRSGEWSWAGGMFTND